MVDQRISVRLRFDEAALVLLTFRVIQLKTVFMLSWRPWGLHFLSFRCWFEVSLWPEVEIAGTHLPLHRNLFFLFLLFLAVFCLDAGAGHN